jgi:hypothetical protein
MPVTRPTARTICRLGRLFPFLALYQTIGCLPDNAFAQVTAENIVLTSALVVQAVTSLIFNTIFGLGLV